MLFIMTEDTSVGYQFRCWREECNWDGFKIRYPCAGDSYRERMDVSMHTRVQQKSWSRHVQEEECEWSRTASLSTRTSEPRVAPPEAITPLSSLLLDMLPHFSSSPLGICFDPCDQDVTHYDKSLFTHRKSNKRMLITKDKSLQSFSQKGRASVNPNAGTGHMLNRDIFPRINLVNLIPRSLFYFFFQLHAPQHCISCVTTATYCLSALLNQLTTGL